MVLDGFAGKTILVVGAGRADGIAFCTASRLASLGASVAIADLPGSEARSLAGTLPGPARHSGHDVDVTDPASIAALVAGVGDRYGCIDGALLASAILRNRPFLEIAADEWRRVVDTNLTGMFLMTQAVAAAMVGRGGSIVCVASNAGQVPRMHNASYGSAKAGVIHLMRCTALELAPHRIRVNALCPGSTATSMAIANKSQGDPALVRNLVEGNLAEWRTGIPLGKLAEAEDQAAAAAFLLSDAARHITGQALVVDGGQTLC